MCVKGIHLRLWKRSRSNAVFPNCFIINMINRLCREQNLLQLNFANTLGTKLFLDKFKAEDYTVWVFHTYRGYLVSKALSKMVLKISFFVKRLKIMYNLSHTVLFKFELECLLPIFIYFNSNFKVTEWLWSFASLSKTETLNDGPSEHSEEKKSQKFVTLHSPFCNFLHRNAISKLPSWVLLNLLFLMKPSDMLQFG